MNLVSIRVITDNLARLVGFYEEITGLPAIYSGGIFAEISTPGSILTIGDQQTLRMFKAERVLHPAQNRSAIIEFAVKDVDREFERLKTFVAEFVQEPTNMPWGNRSLLFEDPDGNLVNFFTPLSQEAISKFESRF